jgi:hypothetical protein
MKLVCTGGRDYEDHNMVADLLTTLKPEEVYVGDCSTGLDKLVVEVCQDYSIPCRVFEARWDEHGRAAGPIRNQEMIAAADSEALVLAFPGGRGTEDTVTRAKARNMMILRVEG